MGQILGKLRNYPAEEPAAPPFFEEPAAPPSFEEPWRNMKWGDKENELKWLNSFSLDTETISHLRILIYGPAGSGKSSFINSVDSVCQNRVTIPAAASKSAETFTVKYKTHRIQKGKPGQYYPFVFNDIMGLEGNSGVSEEDVKLAMQGHMKEGYKFNPASPLSQSDVWYNKNPDRKDKVDLLVCVFSANAVPTMKEGTIAKIKRMRTAARDCGIPQIAILTHIDEACPLVKKSIRNVYKSKYIKRMMENFHEMVGIPLTCIFPMKNYHEEQDLDADIDMLILRALRQMIQIANDHVNKAQEWVDAPIGQSSVLSPDFEEPWRIIKWGDKENERKWLNSFSLDTETINHLRILIYGPAGSGKSSFINSVDSVCQNRVTIPAAASKSHYSFTVKYKTHRIQKGKPGQYYPFVFNDIMGLEGNSGVSEEDVKLAMQGHMKEGYKFNPASPLSQSDVWYNKIPDRKDKVDLLVCVVSANAVPTMKEGTIAKIKRMRTAARDCGIPQIAILTHIDEACPLVKKSIRNVYKSKYIKRMMENFHEMVGIPLTCIFPMKNYHEEQDLDADIDMLILRALRQMIQIANDHVNKAQEWVDAPIGQSSVLSPVLEEPWRKMKWGDKENELEQLNSFSLDTETISHLRILIYGPAGSGKSSFINSVDSVCQNRVTSPAAASKSAETFTVQYETHRIQRGKPGQYYPFVFNDIMGLEGKRGVCEEDVKLAMQGHVKEGYKFNPTSPLHQSDEWYNTHPDRKDKVDLLVCVFSANSVPTINEGTRAKIQRMRTAARDYGIPQMAILTHIDEACPLVKKSIKDVYKSNYIKRMMEHFHEMVGIPLTCIFPMKNYHEEQDLDADIDMLILRALRQMIHIANDNVNKAQQWAE
ncbi:unnamed protein product [Lota lota]